MTGKCSKYTECPAPTHCHEGHEVVTCPNWQPDISNNDVKKEKTTKADKKSALPWTGEPYTLEDIAQISVRSSPIILGIVGKVDAGKTTFLAMIYTLLLNGKFFNNFSFAGSKTLIGWDELHHKLKIEKNNVAFPDPTDPKYHRLFHLALRNEDDNLKDVLFSDASGEAFSLWSKKRDDVNAESARWIYKYSHGFILFIDCQDLIDSKNAAKTEVIDIAQMLKHDLQERPVMAVWSKSDKKELVHQKIKDSLREELSSMFKNYHELDVSNFPTDNPDLLVHENNLRAVEWLLKKIIKPNGNELVIELENTTNLFLNYKGNE